MATRRVFTCVLAGALIGVGSPAMASLKGLILDENPRVAWLERYQDSRQGPETTDKFSGVYKVDGDGAIDVTQIAGDVRVVTGRGNEIRIEAVKRVRHRDPEEATRLLAALRIEVSQVGNRVEVRTVYPRSSGTRNWSGSVDYSVTVPQNAQVSAKTVSGDVSVNAVRGEVRAETVSGDVDVTATPNLALAKTVSGDVRAREISGSTLTLSTVSGTVIANDLKVRTLDTGSVSGDLQLGNLDVERLTAKTLSGNIEFNGSLARGGRYEFHAHSGDVRLTLPGSTAGFDMDASTFSGSVRSDFPVTLRSSAPDQERGRRSSTTRAIRGAFGDGSAFLSLRSFSGNVVITRK
jgi:DUF4097 and DUF4098 domain-containing protein YvlB